MVMHSFMIDPKHIGDKYMTNGGYIEGYEPDVGQFNDVRDIIIDLVGEDSIYFIEYYIESLSFFNHCWNVIVIGSSAIVKMRLRFPLASNKPFIPVTTHG